MLETIMSDVRLSWRARGIAVYMKHTGGTATARSLTAGHLGMNGEQALLNLSALEELEEHGYAERNGEEFTLKAEVPA